MCYQDPNYNGNKVEEITVGDLNNGDQYRTPDGKTMMTIHIPGKPLINDGDGEQPTRDVVDLATGIVSEVSGTIKLGRDRAGRLYASRFLNQSKPTVALTAPV